MKKTMKFLMIAKLGIPIFKMERAYDESKCHGKE